MKEIIYLSAILGAPIALIVGLAVWLESASCHNKGDIVERESRYSLISGCFLRADNGKMLPADAYRDLVE